MTRIIRYGVNKELEAAADELLRQSLANVTSQTAKRDILTPWKQRDRSSREIFVPSGTPEPSARRGMFHRAYNGRQTHLNGADGVSRPRRGDSREQRDPSDTTPSSFSSLSEFVFEQGGSTLFEPDQ